MNEALFRYPLAIIFLIASAILISISIETERDLTRYLLALAVGAVLGAVSQALYERFYRSEAVWAVLALAAAALTAVYYLILTLSPENSEEAGMRTLIAAFALFIAFMWVPSIKSGVTFNESFLAAFKALFIAAFFAGVIMGGASLIVTAVDNLLFALPNNTYAHLANVIFVLFAPIYFLSLIPRYPSGGRALRDEDEAALHAVSCPKFLEILISFILIPIVSIYTIVLVIYIIINIGGSFWQNSLLEPLLVTYAVAVLLIYVLAGRLQNRFASAFRLIFPKILVPIVILQTISSVINILGWGITYTRYLAIIFGVYAAICGVLLSFLPVSKNGWVAALLIIFAAVSVIPPVDAFTVSRISQTQLLESTLEKNGMLTSGTLTLHSEIPIKDKERIRSSIEYLERMGYIARLTFLPKDFNLIEDFETSFGFNLYSDVREEEPSSIYVSLKESLSLELMHYEYLYRLDAYSDAAPGTRDLFSISRNGVDYTMKLASTEGTNMLELYSGGTKPIITFSIDNIVAAYKGRPANKDMLTLAEATFYAENENAKFTVIVESMSIDLVGTKTPYNITAYILTAVK